MTHLIDKDALVKEIEKRIKETESMQPKFDQFWAGQISAFKGILKIINTSEVKETKDEQSSDKVEPKFHKGDWVVVSTSEGDRVVQIDSVEYFKNGHPMYITTEGRWFGDTTKARLLTDVKNNIFSESKAIKSKSWKPTEEQMDALHNINLMGYLSYVGQSQTLIELYNDLKKLC